MLIDTFFILGIITLLLFTAISYIHTNFGKVTLEQIFYNISMPLRGTPSKYFVDLAIRFFLLIICSIIFFYTYYASTHSILIYIIQSFILIILFILLHYIDEMFNISEIIILYINREKKDFFKENYYTPLPEDIIFESKKNIIVIHAESMENFYQDDVSYIVNLQDFMKISDSNINMHETFGTNWTMAAFTSWSFGIPIKMPSRMHQNKFLPKNAYLKNAMSIFEVLEYHGYELIMILGSDKKFQALDVLLNTHGNWKIYDKNYWINSGYSLAEHQGNKWGFKDAFILERTYEIYEERANSDRPFAIFVQTIDTHAPEGYCPPERKKFSDLRDVIINVDFEISKFLKKFLAKRRGIDNIAIIGDHCFTGPLPFMPASHHRKIFNAFYSDTLKMPERKKYERITALDMAPTLLQLAGGCWRNSQFGLGRSLFTNEQSLLEKFGEEKLKIELMQKSLFYYKFF